MLCYFLSRLITNRFLLKSFTNVYQTQSRLCNVASSSKLLGTCNGRIDNLRNSSSDVFQHCDHIRIDDLAAAKQIASKIGPAERELLLQILVKESPNYTDIRDGEEDGELHIDQLRQLFTINTIPFIGFGFLDNAIMVLAGEYIDQSLGTLLCISTMAAAALGNIISDVAGVGLAHYVEVFVTRLGFKSPTLTSKQLESRKARLTVNLARAFGLIVGCLLGMFPLLFFGEVDKSKSEIVL
uniref:Transmembrane protein 65 n=1 Tax=Meloidogyne incognita TaxID=6306 RepID=A0A914LU74_MELIC